MPTLLRVDGEDVLAVTRTFAKLDVHVTLHRDSWLFAICPVGTQPVLQSR